jgi:hypothetical protein
VAELQEGTRVLRRIVGESTKKEIVGAFKDELKKAGLY